MKRSILVSMFIVSFALLSISCNHKEASYLNPVEHNYTYTLVPDIYTVKDKEHGTKSYNSKSIDAEVSFGPNSYWKILINDKDSKNQIINFANFENKGKFVRLEDKEATSEHRVFMLDYKDKWGVSNRVTVDAGPSYKKGKYALNFFVYRHQEDTINDDPTNTLVSMEFIGRRDNLDSVTYKNIMYPPDFDIKH